MGTLHECLAINPLDPEVVRAVARVELDIGNTDSALRRLARIVTYWNLPKDFLSDSTFDGLRDKLPKPGGGK